MSTQSPGMIAALLVPELDVALQMHWAVRLAKARRLDLLILHRVQSQDNRTVEVALSESPAGEATDVIHELKCIIEESSELRAGLRENTDGGKAEQETDSLLVHVRLKLVYFTNLNLLRRGVLEELANKDVVLFTQAHSQITDTSDVDHVRERRLFLRYIPCEVVLCLGLQPEQALSRILVATAPGPNGRAAMKLGAELAASTNTTLTALHVNPGVGVDAEAVGDRRLERLIKRSLGTEYPAVQRRVVVNDNIPQGIRQVWDQGKHDLIVIGATASHIERSMGTKLSKDIPVVIVSTVSPLTNRFRAFFEESIRRLVPQIEREDRIALVDRLQSSAAWNFDFLMLMLLSTIMAAIGLIQNSTAVVIGAMLVAPLMTPLLGVGLALVQGNPVLATLSLRSVAFGLCVSLLGGLIVGLLTPSFVEPTREMLARGSPGLLDLSVAFAAGLAAAYASSRPNLIAALPGVAIAAALVPPIAASGLALSLGDFPLAVSALLLFAINMVTIVLASMTSLWAVGLRNPKKTSDWTIIVGRTVIVVVLALGVFLNLQSRKFELTEKIPAGLVEDVRERLGTSYRLDSLAVAYDELGVQLNVRVVGKTPAPEELATAVRTAASDHYDQPVRVRLLTQIETHVDADE